MNPRQKMIFSNYGCIIVATFLWVFPVNLQGTIEKRSPELSGEQEDFNIDHSLVSRKLEKTLSSIREKSRALQREMSSRERSEIESLLGIGKTNSKSSKSSKIEKVLEAGIESLEGSPEEFFSNDDDDEEIHHEEKDILKEDLFPGEQLENASAAKAVVYPDFKGKIKKATLGCPDVLLSGQLFADPTVFIVFSYVYSLCLMELSLQKYLQTEPYLQKSAKGLLEPSKDALREIQKILPSYLVGLDALIKGFVEGHLREVIDAGRQASQQDGGGIGL